MPRLMFTRSSVAVSLALTMLAISAGRADAVTPAPGAPGLSSSWTSGDKHGLGTSTTTASKVWYTLGDGTTTEVYYPTVDRPQVQDLQYVVTDGASFTDLERDATTHTTQLVDGKALEYRQIDVAKSGRYRITKTYITDPDRATLMIATRFEQLAGTTPLALYSLFNPSLDGTGGHDTGATSGKVLLASDGTSASALGSSLPFSEISNGFSGTASDGLVQLTKDHALTTTYDSAASGNLVQVGRIPVSTDTTFTLALSFAADTATAAGTLTASASAGFDNRQTAYVSGWHDWLAGLTPAPASVSGLPKLRTQYFVALMALRAHEDKTYRGASVASLSIPWGQARSGDGTDHGYRAVWARDLYEVATALQAAGDTAGANRALDYLLTVQERADGTLPHNSLVDGSSTGLSGLQNDEIAYPAVLAAQLGRYDAATWAKVKLSADYLLVHGPATEQERWEEQSGYSPSTVAAEIAGLVSAAEIADHNSDSTSAKRYRDVADLWQASVESWTVTRTGSLGTPHYERIDPVGQPDTGTTVCDTNGAGCADARDLVDGGFLELVRLGVKPASDALISQSVGLVDTTLKVSTPAGPMWHRYNKDGYGEHTDGSAYDGTPGGVGRPWPVLTGERGEYELALGHDASPYLAAMANAANDAYLIPEQVWDAADTGHFRAGQPTDSAAPLAWAMAQYVRLAQSISAGHNVDTPSIVSTRYSGVVTAAFDEAATTTWGQSIFIVGDLPAMGAWDASKAIRLSSASYPDWKQRISLPSGATIQYKFINKSADGTVTWESGPNRTATLPASGNVTYTSSWK